MVRGLAIALIVAAFAGPIALAVAIGGRSTDPETGATVTASSAPDSGNAAAVAEYLVARYLTASAADAEQIAALVALPPNQMRLPDKPPPPPDWLGTVNVEPAGQAGRWVVAVAALTQGVTTTWEVVVEVVGGQGRALGLPIPVAGTTAANPSATQAPQLNLTDPAVVAAAGFVNAALTGADDLVRWTSPDFTPVGLPAAVCSETTLISASSIGDPTPAPGEQLTLLISVNCVTTAPTSVAPSVSATPAPSTSPTVRVMQQVVRVAERAGRWEVTGTAQQPLPSVEATP